MEYLIVRWKDRHEYRVSPVWDGWRPPPDKHYVWAGPYRSRRAAEKALERMDDALRQQLRFEDEED
jgi:hypothetical protein